MDGRIEKQPAFSLEIDKVKNIFRQTHLSGNGRNENDAEHSWDMAVMAYLLKEYYGGCWWDLDVTNEISSTANGKRLYGFRELTSAYASDKDYYITKIY